MRRVWLAATCALLLAIPAQGLAQGLEEDDSPFLAFQGRVGGLYTGGEPFENGATFEVEGMFRLQGPLYLSVFAGTSNFDSTGEIMPISDEFAAFWDQLLATTRVDSIDDLRYRLNFVGGGAHVVLGSAGRIEPHVWGGVGAYQVKFVTSLALNDINAPEDAPPFFTSLQDDQWELGYNVGGGLYYRFNKIINFGGSVTYHAIDTDAVEDMVSITFGMHIRVP